MSANPEDEARVLKRIELVKELGAEEQERILDLLQNPTTTITARAVALRQAAAMELASPTLDRRAGNDRRSGRQRRSREGRRLWHVSPRPEADRRSAVFVPKVEALKVGDPANDDTDVGPVIDTDARERILEWIKEADGDLLTGGEQDGLIKPTVIANVSDEAKVSCQEVFGPVVIVNPVGSVDEAIERANGTRYGLQAGIFTASIDTALKAAERLSESAGLVLMAKRPRTRRELCSVMPAVSH